MYENIESNGLWFLPSCEDDKISGKVSYIKEEGITLEILGSFGEMDQMFSNCDDFIILGILQNGKKVTLVNNIVASRTVNFPGIPTVKYISLYMLIGGHFYDKQSLIFNEISTEYYNLHKWLNISGIDSNQVNNQEFRLDYSSPEEINFNINDYKASFEFSASPKNNDFVLFSLTERVEFKIKNQNATSVFDILRESLIFQGFLTFATFETSYPIKIKLRDYNNFNIYNERKIYNDVELIYKSKGNGDRKQKDSYMFLFTYDDIKDNFQTIIEKWYRYDQEIEPIIYLFLNSFYTYSTMFSENNFLEIIHALETFHRRKYKNNIISKAEYKIRKETILDSVPQEYRGWLQAKLDFGNEPSLHDRLIELLLETKKITILQELISENDKFVKDVKNSRNYYTHYDIRLEKKSLKGWELYYLTVKLRILLISHLLLTFGIENRKINEILQNLKDYHYNFLFRAR